MNREEILQLTSKEIENLLNDSVLNNNFESDDDSRVKGVMIDNIKNLFDNTIKITTPYYTNRELKIVVGPLNVSFKVTSKTTGKTIKVSRLKRKDVKTIGKFKFNDIEMSFHNPNFEKEDLDNFIVKVSDWTCSGGAEISLKHRKEKLIDMLHKSILIEEIQKNEEWKDIRKTVILNASQPKIKQEYFKPNFNQDKWDYILLKTEEVNKEIIDSEIEKIFNIINLKH